MGDYGNEKLLDVNIARSDACVSEVGAGNVRKGTSSTEKPCINGSTGKSTGMDESQSVSENFLDVKANRSDDPDSVNDDTQTDIAADKQSEYLQTSATSIPVADDLATGDSTAKKEIHSASPSEVDPSTPTRDCASSSTNLSIFSRGAPGHRRDEVELENKT